MVDTLPDSQGKEQVEQLKDDFLSSISHELRSPITNIKMATQMLKVLFQSDEKRSVTVYDRIGGESPVESTSTRFPNHTDDPLHESSLRTRAARYIQILERECDREINLLNNFLDLQQLDSGVYGFSAAIIHLQDWLPTMIQPFWARLATQQQQLEVDSIEGLAAITVDPLSLERIFGELLTNACKFTPPGGKILITPLLLPLLDTEGTQLLQLNVTNTKVEISARELPYIFERFYRIPNHDRWKHSGTGLGLALVKELVAHLGGAIAVESGHDRTSFTVTIPVNC